MAIVNKGELHVNTLKYNWIHMIMHIDMLKQTTHCLFCCSFSPSKIATQTLHAQSVSTSYSLIAYNVENLFDADGVAVYSDYLPTDKQGNSQYSPADVHTKISNIIEVLKAYENGEGPDIVTLVELESDHTPGDHGFEDSADLLGQYAHTTLQRMLTKSLTKKLHNCPLSGFY